MSGRRAIVIVMFLSAGTLALAQKGGGSASIPGAPGAPDPAIFEGYWEYAGPDGSPAPRRPDPMAACKDWEAARNKQGLKYKLVSAKRGTSTSQPSHLCVYTDAGVKSETGEVISAYYRCPAGSRVMTLNNSGLIADHRCKCDDPAGTCVPEKPPEPPAPPPASSCKIDSKALGGVPDACKSTKSPPGVDRSPRCTQQPARRTTKEAADKQSAANKAEAQKDRALVAKYERAKAEINKEQLPKKREKFGPKVKSGFPDFPPSALCRGINDVNIGKLCGADESDFAAANNVSGRGKTPQDCTWHHHEDMGRMVLVKTWAHRASGHWGGRSIWKRANNIKDYPRCCP